MKMVQLPLTQRLHHRWIEKSYLFKRNLFELLESQLLEALNSHVVQFEVRHVQDFPEVLSTLLLFVQSELAVFKLSFGSFGGLVLGGLVKRKYFFGFIETVLTIPSSSLPLWKNVKRATIVETSKWRRSL